MSTNPLISLWEVLCEGSFQVPKERIMKKLKMDQSSILGMPPWHPLWISGTIKRQILGMPKASPRLHRLSWGHLRWTKFLSLYILCAILGASFYFAFSLVLFVCWSYSCWILSMGETRSTFSFEYSCALLIFCWVFLATICLLVSSRF